MTTPTLPAYTPAKSLHGLHGPDQLAKAYGKPPEGYRFLKIGETIPVGSIHAETFGKGEWGFVTLATGHKVTSAHLLIAAPITPELIPDDPSAAVALEVVSRTTRKVEFKIARQTYTGPKHDIVFEASNGLTIKSYYHPEFRKENLNSFYIRGTDTRRDNDILSCTPAQFKRIVAALAEYNASLAPKKGAETKIVPSPTVAELQSEIVTLKAKVAEQAKALGKIKEIVA